MGKEPRTLLGITMPSEADLIKVLQTTKENRDMDMNVNDDLIYILEKYSWFEGTYEVMSPTKAVPLNCFETRNESDVVHYAKMQFPESFLNYYPSLYSGVKIQVNHEGETHEGMIKRTNRIFSRSGECVLDRLDLKKIFSK